ncbi:MAG TPA: NAD(P)/FAD-dependent oxidoreductase, partial [bacterium]|nr:NAD(P)/FAD-dependent oxidoreductase [bacterium]
RPRVIVVGAGFGGLAAARALARHPVHVTVIDRKNHHTFQPLLYQVATTVLSPGQIAYPIRRILRGRRNVDVILGGVTGIDVAAQTVRLGDRSLRYDYLIVATGARHSYFGHPEWETLAPGLKTVEDALEIRRRVLLAFELAERDAAIGGDSDGSGRAPAFVVIGGGPTGVELAGALADIARRALARDFSRIDPRHARIVLVEGGPRILPALPDDLSRKAVEQLTRLGVDVRTSAMVTAVEPGVVRMRDEALPAAVVVWAAGVTSSPLGAQLGDVDRTGRIRVAKDLSLPDHPEVFIVGDLAAFGTEDGRSLPALAAVATQQGKVAAANVWRSVRGSPRAPFRYADKGNLATIGRRAAVAQFGRLHVSGFTAWVMWLFVHLLLLVGFRNRLAVLSEWAWAYFTSERSARLITGSTSLPGRDSGTGAQADGDSAARS